MFQAGLGDRGQAPNIGIVITDGASNRDAENTIPYAKDAKLAGITMMAIAVGDKVNYTEVQGIASNSSYVYSVNNFNALEAIQKKIITAACDVTVRKYGCGRSS